MIRDQDVVNEVLNKLVNNISDYTNIIPTVPFKGFIQQSLKDNLYGNSLSESQYEILLDNIDKDLTFNRPSFVGYLTKSLINVQKAALLKESYYKTDTPEEITNKDIIVDARWPYEYWGGHIKGAFNVNTTYDSFNRLIEILTVTNISYKQRIIIHCQYSGTRGPATYYLLSNLYNTSGDKIFQNLWILMGGYERLMGDEKIIKSELYESDIKSLNTFYIEEQNILNDFDYGLYDKFQSSNLFYLIKNLKNFTKSKIAKYDIEDNKITESVPKKTKFSDVKIRPLVFGDEEEEKKRPPEEFFEFKREKVVRFKQEDFPDLSSLHLF